MHMPMIKLTAKHVVALAMFLPIALLAQYLVTISNESYEEAKLFITQDARVVAAIGQVKKIEFKFWSNYGFVESSSSGHADYLFAATTDQGVFTIGISLRKTSGLWHIEAAEARVPGRSQARIVIVEPAAK